ncbi:MAG: hypothetical protein IPK07_34895 [Deltaproteobacteria bacterium]|nr:hypothetical protein [Deltaproteobacteria bacterium]
MTTVTSPGAGGGKSFFSANLARAFASTGRRTLLVDADTRRGVLHRSMGVSASRDSSICSPDSRAARRSFARSRQWVSISWPPAPVTPVAPNFWVRPR